MPSQGALTLWKILKEVSIRQVRKDAEKRFTLGLAGTVEELDGLRAALLSLPPNAWAPADAQAMLQSVQLPAIEPVRGLRGADLVITYHRHLPMLQGLRVPVITADQGMGSVVEQALEERADLILALPRRFPAFREEAARQVVAATSRANAEIAIASALPGVIPMGDVLLPATGVGDIVVLTKNQLILLFKVAAIYGKPLNFRDRIRELLPVVGSAFGWRALARELVGIVPGGVGMVVKGVIAYAGTMAIGKAAALYYQGNLVTAEDVRRLYIQTATSSRRFVESLARGRQRSEAPQ